MQISSVFDSGNIEVLAADSPSQVRLEIRPDAGGNHFQWFHFRVTGARGRALLLAIDNAAKASYLDGWVDYRACASYDRKHWFRVPTQFDGTTLTIEHTPERDVVYFAYFAPYSHERHADKVACWQSVAGVRHERVGTSILGRDIDLLRVGELGPQRRVGWIIARQHPGETMAEWFVEGLLDRLLDPHDPVARAIREHMTLFVVPNMNPDGSALGHLRNNAVGANLNREWAAPSEQRSPEVLCVRRRMEQTGVDFFLDVHGDEALPYNFISGAEGIPSWTAAQEHAQDVYSRALLAASPDFQNVEGYLRAEPGRANMTMATTWVAERFGCLAMTFEQPFKDTKDTPHPDGWSPPRARRLGRAQLDALRAVLDHLPGV